MTEQPLYTTLKVHNEIEFCRIAENDLELKEMIEKALLRQRISYFMKWESHIFNKKKNACIICINDNDKENAKSAILAFPEEIQERIQFQ